MLEFLLVHPGITATHGLDHGHLTDAPTPLPSDTPTLGSPTIAFTLTSIEIQTDTSTSTLPPPLLTDTPILPTPRGTEGDYENDDSSSNFRTITTNGAIQFRTFHQQRDENWLRLDQAR